MAALVAATRLSRRTVDEILRAQVARRWVVEVDGERWAGAGRPGRSFALDASGAYLAAARIDGEIVAVVVADIRGRELAAERQVTELSLPRADRISLVADLATRAFASAGVHRSEIATATVATPGVVTEAGIVELHIPPPRPPEWSVIADWSGFSLSDALGDALGARPVVENDAKLAVLAEHAVGAAQDVEDVVWVTAGNRNGVGIMIGGQILRGRGGRAGEIIRARGLGFDELERNPLAFLGALGRPREAALAAEVLARARAGDAGGVNQVRRFAEVLAPALSSVAWLLSPAAIVLGGQLSPFADLLIPELCEMLRSGSLEAPDIRASGLKTDPYLAGGLARGRADARRALIAGELEYRR